MDQNYAYEEESVEEGLTFKKIGYFFKKGWLRMLVYAVVLALLTTAIAVPIKVFYKSEPLAETSIEFIYDGIEKGLDPSGGTLNTDDIISTTVLSSAVTSAELDGVIKDISKLREAMRVEGVVSEEYEKLVEAAANGDTTAINTLRTYTEYPSRFTIILSDPDELGLSDDQAKLLLNKVVSSYAESFRTRYSAANIFTSTTFTLSESENIEFVDIYDIYTQSLETLSEYMTQLGNVATTESKQTFAALSSNMNVLQTQYSYLNSYLLTKNLWRDNASAQIQLETRQATLSYAISNQQVEIERLEGLIQSFPKNVIQVVDPSTNQITSIELPYPEKYYDYIDLLNSANKRLLSLKNQQSATEQRYEKAKTGVKAEGAELEYIMSTLESLEEQSQSLIDNFVAFYESNFISSAVRQVLPPAVTRRSLDFNLLIVYLIAVIAGVLIAGVVTGVKIVRANTVKANAQAQAPDVTTANEQEEQTPDKKSSKK